MDKDVLEITTDREDDLVIVRLTGELDSMNVADLSQTYTGLLDGGGPLFVMDLAGLEFIDSAGLGGLVALWERTLERGCFVAIGAQSPRVKEVLQITGLNSVLKSYDSMSAAAGAVRQMLASFPTRV
ncbi:MAG TPA: STAS domain-containing protein [Armatimonadota bacterium]|jgi:anti-sigma B factor antagonist